MNASSYTSNRAAYPKLRYKEHLELCVQQQNRTISHRQRQRTQHQPLLGGMCPCRMSVKACLVLFDSQIGQDHAAFSEQGDTGQDDRQCVCSVNFTRLAFTLETGCLGSLDAHAQSALQARLHCSPSGKCTHTPAVSSTAYQTPTAFGIAMKVLLRSVVTVA